MNGRNRPLPKVPQRTPGERSPRRTRESLQKNPGRNAHGRNKAEINKISPKTQQKTLQAHGIKSPKQKPLQAHGIKKPQKPLQVHAIKTPQKPQKPLRPASSLRQYIANRRSMNRCQAVLAFLAVCGVAVVVLTLVFYTRAQAQKLEEKIKIQQSTTINPLGGRSEQECRKTLLSNPELVTYEGRLISNAISTRSEPSGATRNAHWFVGDSRKDAVTMEKVKVEACQNKVYV